MRKESNRITDLIWLLLLIIILPLLLLLAGPLLIIAALWGSISLGRIQLRPSKYYQLGRIWAFGFGLLLWAFTWGSLVWFWPADFAISTIMPPSARAMLSQVTLPVTTPTATNTSQPPTPAVIAATTTTATSTYRPGHAEP